MGSNWAEEFRRKVERQEGKYEAAENFDDLDEFLEEEEETELEESRDEVEEETEKVEQEPEKAEVEKPSPKPVLDIGKRTAELLNSMIGQREPVKQSAGGNPMSAAAVALMGLLVLQSLPGIFNTMSSAFQPFMGGQSYRGGAGPQGYPVQCSYCGWTGIGVSGMLCPRCGK